MSRNYYLPKDESGRAELLEHLARHLAAHLGTLDLTDADMAELQADAAAYRYTLATAAAAQAHARQWTAFKTEQYEGKGGALPFPASPAAPEPVTAVPAGIIPRLIRLVARIKAARNYSEDIGRELGIVGTTLSTDSDRAKPILQIGKQAGRPVIRWAKGQADNLEIHVDRGDSRGFALLTIAQTTRVPDPVPLPATPTTWKYKAIYRVKDEQIGNWSDMVSIAVGG